MFIWEQPKYPSTEEQIHTHTHTQYTYIYIYTHTHIYIYIYIYIHTMVYYSAIKRMKFCLLQQQGWAWRVSCLVK